MVKLFTPLVLAAFACNVIPTIAGPVPSSSEVGRREFAGPEVRGQILDARDFSLLGVRTEINLDRNIGGKSVYPAIDVLPSSTRRDGPLIARPRKPRSR